MPRQPIEEQAAPKGQFEFGRRLYPCEEHAQWLGKLDDRLWALLLATCGGALASLITLIIIVARKG